MIKKWTFATLKQPSKSAHALSKPHFNQYKYQLQHYDYMTHGADDSSHDNWKKIQMRTMAMHMRDNQASNK